MLYLIMRCDELNDQYECDADRTPIAIVEDWKDWANNHITDYDYEIWEYDGSEFSRIKEYDEGIEEGMALYYWEDSENPEVYAPHVIAKFPSFTRNTAVPLIVKETIKKGAYTCDEEEGVDDNLISCGYITWYNKEDRYYVYGKYSDNHYSLGY